jgi:hypothetical protein
MVMVIYLMGYDVMVGIYITDYLIDLSISISIIHGKEMGEGREGINC